MVKSFLSERPQSLCKMCGKCCRVVTCAIPYNELLNKAEQNDTYAKDFLEIFEPYESIEFAKSIDEDTVDNILDSLSEEGKPVENITFYRCKYLQDNNLCKIYNDRKELCKNFPSSPFAVVPPKCGFEAWLLSKREKIKERVRKAKEELIELQLLKEKIDSKETFDKISAVEHKLNKIIELYEQYGSYNW